MRISLQFFTFFLITFHYFNELLLYSSLFEYNQLRFADSVELTYNGVGASIFLHVFYIFTYLILFIFLKIPKNNIEPLHSNKTKSVFVLFFTIVSLFKAYDIFSAGLADFILRTRSNEGGIGGLTYVVLIGWPILMLVYKFSLFERVFSWIVLVVLNLITGFRIILLMSILLHFIHQLRGKSYSLNFKMLFLFVCLLLASYFFSLTRVQSILVDESLIVNFLNSLNRSNSVLTVAYAYDSSILFPTNGFLELSLQPLQAFIGYFIDSARWSNDYEIKVFSEFFYKNFLYLRGNEFYYASGFSNSMLLVLFSHFGWGTLIVIPIILALLAYLIFFYQVKDIHTHINLSLVYTFFLVGSIESYSVAIGYLFYGVVFVSMLRLLKFIL